MKVILMILTIILIILLCSCSATYHIKRAKKKDPSLFEVKKEVVIDTVYKIVENVDTLFKYTTDTVFITKDSVRIKYAYSYKDSLVWIEADCPDIPEVTKTETKTETIFIEPTFWDKVKWGLVGLGVAGLIILAIKVL